MTEKVNLSDLRDMRDQVSQKISFLLAQKRTLERIISQFENQTQTRKSA